MNLQENISRIREMMGVDSSSQNRQLYVDMGGVLFSKGSDDEKGANSSPSFIGKELWNNIKQYKPIILTSTGSKNSDIKKQNKLDLIRNTLGGVEVIVVVNGSDKARYAKNNILIDDSENNIVNWKNAGGIGILHRDISNTLKELGRYI